MTADDSFGHSAIIQEIIEFLFSFADPSEAAIHAQTDAVFMERFIQQNQRFIKKCAYQTMNRFITESDDEFSVALIAFHEAVQQLLRQYGFSFFGLTECSPHAGKTKNACAAVVAVLLAAGAVFAYQNELPCAYVDVDVEEASLKYVLNRRGQVLQVRPLNKDGEVLAEELRQQKVRTAIWSGSHHTAIWRGSHHTTIRGMRRSRAARISADLREQSDSSIQD